MLTELFALASVLGMAQHGDTAAYTANRLRAELPALVAVDSSKWGYSLRIDSVTPSPTLQRLVRANRRYVLYLTSHAPAAPWDSVDFHGSRAQVKARFLAKLSQDSVYLTVLAESVERMAHGAAATRKGAARRRVSVQRAQDVASRFFYPDAILPNGRIQSHVCVAINDVIDMQGGRDPALEAFVYSAIFEDLDHPRFDVSADFEASSRLINRMDLSSDSTLRLRRAQGVMWGRMVESARLRRLIRAAHARDRSYLPFELVSSAAQHEGARTVQ